MKSRRYDQVWEGDWEDWGWRGNLEMCCDCNMVHKTNYRVGDRGQLQRQVFVDRKKTYAARRRSGIKLERTK